MTKKKFIVFIIVIGLLILSFFQTNGYTYINGELNPEFTTILSLVAILVAIAAFLYLISDVVIKHVSTIDVGLFKEEEY